MTGHFDWPDLVGFIILGLGSWRGWLRGFVSELTGIVALAVAIVAAFLYPGMWDDAFANWTHLGPGSAHVVGMLAFAAVAYAIVATIGYFLGGIAKLPLLNIANALLGAGVGFVKATLFLWIVIFIALFFPLSKDLRADLGHSYIVAQLERPNGPIDTFLKRSLPWFAKPFSNGLFGRHRV